MPVTEELRRLMELLQDPNLAGLAAPPPPLPPMGMNQPPPVRPSQYIQAQQLEQQAAPRDTQPHGLKQNIVAGIQSAFVPGGVPAMQQMQYVQERQRQQDLLERAKGLRSEGLAQEKLGIDRDQMAAAEQDRLLRMRQLGVQEQNLSSEDAYRKAQIAEIQRKAKLPIEVSPGASLYDPEAKTNVFTAPKEAMPTQKNPGFRDVEVNGKTVRRYFDQSDPSTVIYEEVLGPVKQTGPSEDVLDLRRQSAVDRIRGAYNAHPAVKKFQTVAAGVEFAKGLDPNTKNSADDIGLLYAFAKAMDPDSVVREGEYATVQKYGQSWAEKFGFDVRRIFSNTAFLTPQARLNMKTTIEAKAKPEYQLYRHTLDDFRKDMDRILPGGGALYIPDYGEAFGTTQAGGGGQPVNVQQWEKGPTGVPQPVKSVK